MTTSTTCPATILVVDDDPQERTDLAATISSLGYGVVTAGDGEEALSTLGSTPVDVIVTDLFMPRVDGFQLLRTLLERGDLTPAIVLTGLGSIERAMTIVHDLRAFWFLEKPAQESVLAALLDRAIVHRNTSKEAERLQRELSYRGVLGEMVGNSGAMQQVFSLIQQVAPTTASVLITGESGTGKEMVARAIHKLSPRAPHPFIAVNCAALPENLIESELYGHERGAFTGALERRAGCFEQASGGTLFLDEIAELPSAMQAKLLRTLENSKVRRLGGAAEISVDVRVLAATNQLLEANTSGNLREDLYYRLNVFRIDLPPLRHHKEDLPPLVDALIADLNRKHDCRVVDLHPEVLDRLMQHSWPGNVRELRNVLERAVILAGEGTLIPAHIPTTLGLVREKATSLPEPAPSGSDLIRLEPGRTLDEVEEAYIRLTLKHTNNNKKRAAAILGMSIRTLYNRLAKSGAPDQETLHRTVGGNGQVE